MSWKCWVILIAIAIIATGVVVWQNREVARLEALQESLMVERREAMSAAASARQDLRRHETTIADLRAQRDDLKALLDASAIAVTTLPAPRTMDDYRVHNATLRRRISLLESGLSLCDQEAKTCGLALAAAKHEKEQYRRVIDIDTARFKLLYKQQRKEKRNKILIGIGGVVLGGLVGYGIGAAVK